MRIETDTDASDRPMAGVPIARPYGHYVGLDAANPDRRLALISESRGRLARADDLELLLPCIRIMVRTCLHPGVRAEDDKPRLDFGIFEWRPGDQWELVLREVELNP
jgi:hypothetical protein